MKIIFFLIACSVVLALLFLMAFFWAQKNGQNQDLYTPSVRILLDDEIIEEDDIISKTDKKPS
jgi:cbb3-type cytochrome oxidase maturation protein